MTLLEFFSMSGYGEYVWSAYGFALAVLVINVVCAVRRLRKSQRLQSSIETQSPH